MILHFYRLVTELDLVTHTKGINKTFWYLMTVTVVYYNKWIFEIWLPELGLCNIIEMSLRYICMDFLKKKKIERLQILVYSKENVSKFKIIYFIFFGKVQKSPFKGIHSLFWIFLWYILVQTVVHMYLKKFTLRIPFTNQRK